jgi:hypothetical protein
VSRILNTKVEPTWLTNSKYPVLRPDPHKSLDTTLSEMTFKSYYSPKHEVMPEQYDYYGNVRKPKDITGTDDIMGSHAHSHPQITLKQ